MSDGVFRFDISLMATEIGAWPGLRLTTATLSHSEPRSMLATADAAVKECRRKSERKSSACSEFGVAIVVEVSSSALHQMEILGEGVFVKELKSTWKEQEHTTNQDITRRLNYTWQDVSSRMCCEWCCQSFRVQTKMCSRENGFETSREGRVGSMDPLNPIFYMD